MANLSDEVLASIFNLQKQLFQVINQATATEYTLVERYGETEETLPELEELQNIKERATSYYSRLSRLVVQVAVYQPIASSATLNLLRESIEQTQAIIDAGKANIQEIKKNWSLL